VTAIRKANEDVTLQQAWDIIRGTLSSNTEYLVHLLPGIHKVTQIYVAPPTRLNVSIHHLAHSPNASTVIQMNITVPNTFAKVRNVTFYGVTLESSHLFVSECEHFSLRQVHLAGTHVTFIESINFTPCHYIGGSLLSLEMTNAKLESLTSYGS
jgi:hypothetical protein